MGGNASFLVNPGCPSMKTLPDYLRPGLDIVLIGLNPSTRSVEAGHYFANPRNRFWKAVSAADIVGRPVGPEDDAALLAHGIGFTDVVKRPTSQASGLTSADYRQDAPGSARKVAAPCTAHRLFPRAHRVPGVPPPRGGDQKRGEPRTG